MSEWENLTDEQKWNKFVESNKEALRKFIKEHNAEMFTCKRCRQSEVLAFAFNDGGQRCIFIVCTRCNEMFFDLKNPLKPMKR